MRLLQRDFEVVTRYGGGFVQEIDGVAGGREGGRPVDWFYYVNGIEAGDGAAEQRVAPGDRIWWDHHDWGGAMRIPAVVGSFPAPFDTAIDGRRIPVRLVCLDGAERGLRRGRRRASRTRGSRTSRAPCSSSRRARRSCACSSARGRRCARDTAARKLESGPGGVAACSPGPTRRATGSTLLDARRPRRAHARARRRPGGGDADRGAAADLGGHGHRRRRRRGRRRGADRGRSSQRPLRDRDRRGPRRPAAGRRSRR